MPFDEGHPKNPISPYGISKLTAEHYSRIFNHVYGLKITSLRYFTVYGPRIRPDLAISIFTEKALKNEPITVFGDGTKTRDFTHIEDAVNATLLAMKKGDGNITYSNPIKGDAEHTWANVEKAKKELDWSPKTSLKESLQKVIEWKLNQMQ